MGLALEIVQPRLRWSGRDGAPDHLETFLDLALLERDHGDVIERVEVARVLLEDRHITLHGKLVLALAMQRECLLDGLLLAAGGGGSVHAALHAPATAFGQSVGKASAPFPKFVIRRGIPCHELRKQRGTSKL